MDVAALSISMHQASLSQQVSIAVAKKAMDVSKENSDALVKLLEQSVTPHLGKFVDVRI